MLLYLSFYHIKNNIKKKETRQIIMEKHKYLHIHLYKELCLTVLDILALVLVFHKTYHQLLETYT